MTDRSSQGSSFWRSRWGVALCVLLAGAALAFLIDHRLHALQWLPFALLLACPLMHFFMHRGHGHHGAAPGKEAGGCCGGAPREKEKP